MVDFFAERLCTCRGADQGYSRAAWSYQGSDHTKQIDETLHVTKRSIARTRSFEHFRFAITRTEPPCRHAAPAQHPRARSLAAATLRQRRSRGASGEPAGSSLPSSTLDRASTAPSRPLSDRCDRSLPRTSLPGRPRRARGHGPRPRSHAVPPGAMGATGTHLAYGTARRFPPQARLPPPGRASGSKSSGAAVEPAGRGPDPSGVREWASTCPTTIPYPRRRRRKVRMPAWSLCTAEGDQDGGVTGRAEAWRASARGLARGGRRWLWLRMKEEAMMRLENNAKSAIK